jgi:hypothetical protein
MEHLFTAKIKEILTENFNQYADDIFEKSQLIQYINEKTRSAGRGSKARSSFANLYAIYVIIEDYIANNFNTTGDYSRYEGALFNKLLARQRELPFGTKLQNHALNNRMNAEFEKFFPNSAYKPILRDQITNRYWINEHLLNIKVQANNFNIAISIIEIINEYIKTKRDSFIRFVRQCEELQDIENTDSPSPNNVQTFIGDLLAPNIDARLFEIVSFAILKVYYHDQTIIWGYEMDKLNIENLTLYKTGRTNANDGGIDFVMKPLGKFFQVTETLDFKKYFLDIDKIQKFPMTFVIKSDEEVENLKKKIKEHAYKTYSINAIVEKYMDCIEEIINIPTLKERLNSAMEQGHQNQILDEIILQSKVEFNYLENEDEY